MTRRTLRRYPALGFLAAAALLASLLPSALRVPLSGPSTSAELAPVPGKSDVAQGDLSALGETSTGGLGSGSGLGLDGTGGRGSGGSRRADEEPSDPPPPGAGRNPRSKRCVGNPPRQTEDPMSPPCVAFFKGDNGGTTTKGVTTDEIVVVNESAPCSRPPEFFDYDDEGDPRRDPVYAAYLRYFNDRFQTYGRRVRAYGVTCGAGHTAIIKEAEERYRPFFFSSTTSEIGETTAREIAGYGTFVVMNHAKRSISQALAPFVLSYVPDLDNRLASAAEFLCARLAGRLARFAGDPTYHLRTRKFGLYYNYESYDQGNEGAGWFLDRVRARCGDVAGEFFVSVGQGATVTERFARMRAAGVTTVVAVDPSQNTQALAVDWRPEWFLPDSSGVGFNLAGRAFWSEMGSSAFGIHAGRRLGPPAEQYHRKAYAEGCGCTSAPPAGIEVIYNKLLLLFTGIQAAGPKLTPANLDKGLHAIAPRRSLDPFAPAAYFAPGNYSFVKDHSAMWWDPTGLPPGSHNVGCWRLVEDGLRYRTEDWQTRPGDDGIQGQGQPCQGEDS